MTPAPSPSAPTHPTQPGDPIARLINVQKTYYKPDGSVLVQAVGRAEHGLDLTIPRGQYLAIMGASGSGKSTLMNILGCLDRPTAGQYLVEGKDVAKMSDAELSLFRGRTIGFVFQAFNLIPQETIVENVATPLFYQGVGAAERRRLAIESLELVGLGDRLTHRPRELSGGQQQRVAIARSLVTKPGVLMADEPTGNLDSATGESILELIEDLHKRGMTIIMVTHDARISHRCQRIVRLKDGMIESDHLKVSPSPASAGEGGRVFEAG